MADGMTIFEIFFLQPQFSVGRTMAKLGGILSVNADYVARRREPC